MKYFQIISEPMMDFRNCTLTKLQNSPTLEFFPKDPYNKETLDNIFATYMDAKKPAVEEKAAEAPRVMK